MKKLSVSFTTKKIKQKIDRNDIVLNHPIQRKAEQWTHEQRSLLIHSLLNDYPIPPLYAIKDEEEGNRYSILDGKQRLTSIRSYINNEWALSKEAPEAIIDGEEYDIAGLKFSELHENVKQELEDANLLMYIFEDCSEEEIEEIFYRLNNGTALTKDQKTRAKLGTDLVKFIDEILSSEFIKEKSCFTKYQLKKAEDQTCVLQTLMLLTDYKFKRFGNNDVLNFVQEYKNNYNKTDLDLCKKLFEEMDKAFDEQNKLIKKINIPMFIMTLKKSNEMNIPFNKYKEWINNFVSTYDTKGEYASTCIQRTTDKEVVKKRLNLIYDSFTNYIKEGE